MLGSPLAQGMQAAQRVAQAESLARPLPLSSLAALAFEWAGEGALPIRPVWSRAAGGRRCQAGDAHLLSVLRAQSWASMGVGSQDVRPEPGGWQLPGPLEETDEACWCLGEVGLEAAGAGRGQWERSSPVASGGHCRNSGLALGPAGEVGGSAAGMVTHGEGTSLSLLPISSLCSWQDPLQQRVEGVWFPQHCTL